MPQIPDSVRPHLAALAKYHFWILAALVPLLVLPALFSANGALGTAISTQKSRIDGQLSALRSIQGEPSHPNDRWVAGIDGRTEAVRTEILDEWRGFWESQQPLRVWPQMLGPDFLGAIAAVERGDRRELVLTDLQTYQNKVPDVVRTLPGRMGCKEAMGTLQGAEDSLRAGRGAGPESGLSGDELDSPEASLALDPLVWKAEDQRRLFYSFVWRSPPSTTQVRLAQEELWVYGMFCDVIRKMNAEATGAFNASITLVEELAVGHPAAEESPGGRGGGRILWKVKPDRGGPEGEVTADGMPPPDPGASPPEGMGREFTGPGGRPFHPRFPTTGGGFQGEGVGAIEAPAPVPSGGEGGEPGAAQRSPDDALRDWIYVDFSGRPLLSDELATLPDAAMVHLVPFTLRVVMDQRQVDRLLQELAAGPVPVDVRQVRINPPGQLGNAGGPLAALSRPEEGAGSFEDSGGGLAGSETRRRRPYDVKVELRGTVGLATPPDAKVLGGGAGGEAEAGGVP